MNKKSKRLTDEEKSVFLQAMARERRVCEKNDREGRVADEVIRKIMNSYLWEGGANGQRPEPFREAGGDNEHGDSNEANLGDAEMPELEV